MHRAGWRIQRRGKGKGRGRPTPKLWDRATGACVRTFRTSALICTDSVRLYFLNAIFFAIFHRVFRRRSREGRSYCDILTEVADPPLVRLGCRSIGTQTRSSATLCSSVLCFPLAFVRWATIPSPPQRISFNRHYVWREYLLPRSGVGGMTYGTWYSHAVVGQEVPRNRGDFV